DLDRVLDLLVVADLLDQGAGDPDGPLGLVRDQDVGPVIVAAGVDVHAVVADELGQALQDHPVPVAPPGLTARDELDAGVGPAHHLGVLPGRLDVVLGRQLPDLPRAVHLVAQAPQLDSVRGVMAVGPAQVGPVGVTGAVAVLDPGRGLVHGAGAHVHAQVRLGADQLAVAHELVGAEPVGLLAVPGQVGAPRPLVPRADAVGEVVAGHEVAPGPAEQRRLQPLDRLDHVGAETLRVRPRRALVEHAAVAAPAQVLGEAAQNPAVNGSEHASEIEFDDGHARLPSFGPRPLRVGFRHTGMGAGPLS